MSDVRFNINGDVRVKLTPLGRQIWRSYWKPHDPEGNMEKKIDPDGWLKIQLWEVMATFGPHMYNGGDVPFETEIILEVEP